MRLSKKDLEAIGARIFNDYKHLPRFKGQAIRKVDPKILACELCGYSMDYAHLSTDGLTLGATSQDEMAIPVFDDKGQPAWYWLDGKTFLIESILKDDLSQIGRHNFTVMHETAHQILGRLFPDHRRTAAKRVVYYRGISQRPPICDWGEWQADNLASVLLLPPEIVWSALHDFGLGDRIDVLNRVFRPAEYERFTEMADFLGASKQALAIRLKGLGWLKKEYLRYPYEMVNIWKEEDEP